MPIKILQNVSKIFLVAACLLILANTGNCYVTDQSVTVICGVFVHTGAPTTPTLFDPGDIDNDGNYNLSWTESLSSAGIDSYELQEDITPSFTDPSRFYTSSGELTHSFFNHEDGTFYYRVSALDKNGSYSDWSNVVDIVVEKTEVSGYNFVSFEAEDMDNPYFKKNEEKEICVDMFDQYSTDISQGKIVWVDSRDYNSSDTDIYMFDLSTGIESIVSNNIYKQENPSIYGNRVVWEDYRNGNADIYMLDLTTGVEEPVCIAPGDQGHPVIYKDKVVWEDYRNIDADIYMLDLVTGVEKAICSEAEDQILPSIYKDKIVWQDYREGDADIYMFDFAKNREIAICVDYFDQEFPKIYGNRIIWSDWRNYSTNLLDIYVYDLDSATERPLLTTSLNEAYASIFENKVVWVEDLDYSSNVHVYDIDSKEDIVVKDAVVWDSMPKIDKNIVVFKDGPYENGDIFACLLGNYSSIIYDKASGAWGGAYVEAEPTLDYYYSKDITIPVSGDYAIWVRMSSETDLADSVFINVNGSEDIIAGDDADNDLPGFSWVNFRDGMLENKIIIYLADGRNTINFKVRESGTKIDSIIITDNLGYIPPEEAPMVQSWEGIVDNGFGDINNFTSRMKVFKDGLFVSTSSTSYQPAIYKSTDGLNFEKIYELTTSIQNGRNMYRTLEMDEFKGNNLYTVTDNYWGGLYITHTNDGSNFTTNFVGNRGWWTKDIVEFDNLLYAGFYNDWNLYFVMKRTDDPMIHANWQGVSNPAFMDNFIITKKKVKGKIIERISYLPYANLTAESSCVFKDYLYIGTYNYGYLGRTTEGAQVWRTYDGITWEPVLVDGFGDSSNRSIDAMAVFGGYLYASTNKSFEPCKIYRTDGEFHDGKIIWEPVILNGFGRQYNTYVSSLYSYMGRLYAITSSWLYSSTIPKEEYSGGGVYTTANGTDWVSISDNGILNIDNTTLENIEAYKGSLYINARNSITGTQVIRGRLE